MKSKNMIIKAAVKSILLLFIFIYLNDSTLFAQNAEISESLQEIKTYPYSDPNPVADDGKIYPYFRFDGYSITGHPQKWKVVTLENPYIKVFVTPEIGGKIWGALDKASGKMFIYNNNVVKFRNIAMRGPWTSGGIESNFGIIGHAPTGSSPVDYILLENSDGSVSCVIGALDLITGTTWRVEIRLPKDKAFFETNVLWHNKTELNQPYYHWMNGAARASDDLQFFFPGHSHIFHDGKPNKWPSDADGHNLSMYAENNFGSYKSYHILGEYSGFFGGYYYKDHLGFGNWSTYTDKPGKKLWIWGLSRQGMVWENLLTDTNGQYIEMQTGRLFNQAAESSSRTPFKHREFPAYATDTWSEIWFPVKETEGMKSASKFGVLNLNSNNEQLKIYFSPLQKIDDDITVKVKGKIIFTKHLKLKPLEIFIDSIVQEYGDNIEVSIGNNKLSYSPSDNENNSLNRPLVSPANFDWKSIQGLAIKGKEAARQLNSTAAMEYYLKCLEKDPNYLDALNGIAELYYHRMEYDTALIYAKRSLAIDTYDGAANFIYGLINRKNNFIADAKDGFSIAAHSMEYRSAAFTELAAMYIYDGSWSQAAEYSKRALDFNKYNLSAYQVLISSQRRQNLISDSKKTIDLLLILDPLNHFARFEKYIIKNDVEALQEFKQFIRNELPHETFLELAITYYNLGLIRESLQVLENAPDNPIISYWQSYLYNKFGDKNKSLSFLKTAEEQSPYLIYPFREETVEVLIWATTESSNWKGKYYLALIYWKHGQLDKTKELFTACKNKPDYPPFYITRAKIFQISDISQSIKDTRTAIDLDNKNWRAWMLLSKLYKNNGDHQNSFNAVETIYKQNPNDYRFAIPYAKALYRFENYKECISILDKIEVLPFEGANNGRVLYRDAHIMLAIRNIEQNKLSKALTHLDDARLWPENLGAGKPYQSDELLEDYLEYLVRQRMNQSEKSAVLLQKINIEFEQKEKIENPNNIIKALILRENGKEKEALSVLQTWSSSSPNNDLANWTLAEFNDKKDQAQIIANKIKMNPNFRPYYNTLMLSNLN